MPGDGTSLWTVTHARDFARAFVALLGDPTAYGDAVHITSDVALTWNALFTTMAQALGVHVDLVPIASSTISAARPELAGSLLGDKAQSMVFDNTKIRTFAPGWQAHTTFAQGAREIARWHVGHDGSRADPGLDAAFDALIARARA